MAIMQHVSNLPEELLDRIFESCVITLPTENSDDKPVNLSKLSRTDAPFNISHVCSSRRQRALSLPVLWSKFVIEDMKTPRVRFVFDILSHFLVRSDRAPLDFRVSFCNGSEDVWTFRSIMRSDGVVFSSVAIRFKIYQSIRMNSSKSSEKAHFASLGVPAIPRLELLEMRNSTHRYSGPLL